MKAFTLVLIFCAIGFIAALNRYYITGGGFGLLALMMSVIVAKNKSDILRL